MKLDLRSDTVTRPGPEMRRAMAEAEVGDDVYGEDPTVAQLERRVAELLGKPAALFVPSGTMANQIALLLHCRAGDEVYAAEGAHCGYYESGAAGAWAGVQIVEVGRGGSFSGAELGAALKPRAYYCPNPRLVVIENTHNRGGGSIFPWEQQLEVVRVAREQELSLHLDGARLWNAAIACGRSERVLAEPFDTVSVCFSKGLGAPVGSALCGSEENVLRARRWRKMLGGGMRQAGILAAGALYALSHQREALAEDHRKAARISEIVGAERSLRASAPETNIVMIDLEQPATPLVLALAEEGVLVSAFGPERLRLVTHRDVSLAQVEAAARTLCRVARETRGISP